MKINHIRSNHCIDSEVSSVNGLENSRNKNNSKVYTVSGWITNKLKLAEEKTKLSKAIYDNTDYCPSNNIRIK